QNHGTQTISLREICGYLSQVSQHESRGSTGFGSRSAETDKITECAITKCGRHAGAAINHAMALKQDVARMRMAGIHARKASPENFLNRGKPFKAEFLEDRDQLRTHRTLRGPESART